VQGDNGSERNILGSDVHSDCPGRIENDVRYGKAGSRIQRSGKTINTDYLYGWMPSRGRRRIEEAAVVHDVVLDASIKCVGS